jgi:hypothetical protein
MKKRGQVTLFVVVGILIVVIASIFAFTFSQSGLKRNKALSDSVPEKFSPVKNFVESCISSSGERAVRMLSERGGYIFSRDYPMISVYGLAPSFDTPSDADSFFVHAFSNEIIIPELAVPYWHYLATDNSAGSLRFASRMPALKSSFDNGRDRIGDNSVEAQIDRYVSQKLLECLDDFKPFKERGMLIEPAGSVPEPTTYVRENDVLINVHYPVLVNISGDSELIENFYSEIPARLEKVYEIARMITNTEIKQHFLENNILNLMALESSVDSPLLPPMTDFTFEFGSPGNSWQAQAVKQNMKSLLLFTSLMQVEGANNYQRILVAPDDASFETRQKVYDNMILPVLAEYYGYKDIAEKNDIGAMKVFFKYFDWWDIYFNVNDENGVIRPKTVGLDFDMLKIGFQKYETIYDVSWPVLVTVVDTASFNGKGLSFNFGLEGNIRDNGGNLSSSASLPDITADARAPSICNENGKEIEVKVYDDTCTSRNSCNPVEGAYILLVVSGEEVSKSCPLGVTGAGGALKAKVPLGVLGGMIKAVKPDYLSEFVVFEPAGDVYTIKGMRPIRKINVQVMKKTLSKANGVWNVFDPVPKPLDAGEEAVVTMTRIENAFEEEKFSSMAQVSAQEPLFETNFVSGTYAIEAVLMGPASQDFQDSLSSALDSVNDIGVNTAMTAEEKDDAIKSLKSFTGELMSAKGGARFGGNQGSPGDQIIFSKAVLDGASTITIYVLELKDLNIADPADMMATELRELTRRYKNELIPEVS